MIGGEFDLSVGSIIGVAGMTVMLLTRHFDWPLWPAIGMTVALSLGTGFANGYLVVRTGLPSFIVTLGTLFVLRGLTIAISRLLTRRTQLGGLDQSPGYESARLLFASDPAGPFRVTILWWLGLAAVATWALARTRWGNWIFAAGGAPDAARKMGVPVDRVKIGLFMTTALAACLVGVLQAVRFNGADALRGEQQEFRAIIAVVIGGTLLSGGYGSAVGAVLGALDLRHGAAGDRHHRRRRRLVPGFPRRDAGRGRSLQRLHPPASGGAPVSEPILRVERVGKRFGNVVALRDVSLSVHAGRVTCLLGDNGAGKSTLIQILSGVHQPSEGRYLVDGEPVAFTSPRDALSRGIATVYQDLAMIPLMSIWRNFVLGAEPVRGRGPFERLDLDCCAEVARLGLAELGVNVRDVAQPVAR